MSGCRSTPHAVSQYTVSKQVIWAEKQHERTAVVLETIIAHLKSLYHVQKYAVLPRLGMLSKEQESPVPLPSHNEHHQSS